MNYESCEKQAPDIGIIWSLLVPGPASSCGLVPPGQGAKTSTLARGVGFCIWLHEAQFSQISWIATCTGPCCRGNSVARPADASKQRRVCSQTAGRLGGASAPRHTRRGPPRPTRRPGMANVSGACRAGRILRGAGAGDRIRGPVPCGTGFSHVLGKPTQVGSKRCPVGHRSRSHAYPRAASPRPTVSAYAFLLGFS